MRVWTCLAVVLALLAFPFGPAWGHATATGLATVETMGDGVLYTLTVQTGELPDTAARMLESAARGDAANARRATDLARDAVVPRAGLEPCLPGRARILGGAAGEPKVRLELLFHCAALGGPLHLREDWRGVFGAHYRTILSIRGAPGTREAVLGEGSQEIGLALDAPGGGWANFAGLGVSHILTGADHLLFLLALLAGQRGLWPVARMVTAFTVAHSVTLGLAVTGVLAVSTRLVEPAIAASIVWVAMENLFLAPSGRRRVGIAFLFGLVHGMGFADALTGLALSGPGLARALIAFNLGVEAGQLVFVAVALPAIVWARTRAGLAWLPRAVSIPVAVAGAIWFVERTILG